MKPPPQPRSRPTRPGLSDAEREGIRAAAKAAVRDESEPPKTAVRTTLTARAKESLTRDNVTLLQSVRDERRRATWHARRHHAIWTIGIGLVLAALVWAIFFSPLFALQHIKVKSEGPEVSESAVTAVLEPYRGTPLPRLSTTDLRSAVGALTAVKTVKVARSWPREVIVTVEGREAVAAQENPGEGGGFQLLDAHGVVLAQRPDKPEGIPLINVGGEEHLRGALIADVLTALGALPDEVRGDLTYAAIDGDGLMSFTLNSGARVVWGSAGNTELKSRVLQVLLTKDASVYDVSAPRSPVTK